MFRETLAEQGAHGLLGRAIRFGDGREITLGFGVEPGAIPRADRGARRVGRGLGGGDQRLEVQRRAFSA